MLRILYIGLGGFLGAVARYVASKFVNNFINSFPLGTLVVNVSGSFVLGFIMYSVISGKNISPEFRDFSMIGFIGAYTTMSTFAYESFRLFELNELMMFIFNVVLNLVLCLLAVYFGKELAVLLTTNKG
jgi:fluoride exporter